MSSSASRAGRAPASPRSRGPCATGWRPRATRCCSPSSPGDTEVGRKVRQIVLDPATGELSHRTESLLYAADKAEHVDTVVLPALAPRRGRHHRPVRRLDAGLPGRRPGPRRRRGRGDRPLGHAGPAAPPHRRPRPRARAGAGPLRGPGPHRGGVDGVPRAGPGGLPHGWPSANPDALPRPRRTASGRRARRRGAGAGPAAARPGPAGAAMTVWDELVGQRALVEVLSGAAGGHGMTHSWLFTGPPGSGRSNAAVAFAAALQCEDAGLRCVPVVPPGAGLQPSRRDPGAHREALHRRRRRARPGAPRRPGPGRRPLAGARGRGRRPADRPGLQRAAQGDRGAHRPDRLAALRADVRGRAAHDPVAVPAGRPDHADRRRRGRVPGPHRGRLGGPRGVRRPRQPGPHRPGPGAGARRGHPQPPARGGVHPVPADEPRAPR